MIYHYEVMHSDDAVHRLERFFNGKNPDDIEREYDGLVHPLSEFCEAEGATGTCEWKRGDEAVVVGFEAMSEGGADALIDKFLVWWNGRNPGLGLIVNRRVNPDNRNRGDLGTAAKG